jgi:hypothetical protein
MEDIRQAIGQHGYTEQQLEATLHEYANLGILMLNPTHTRIDVVGSGYSGYEGGDMGAA